MEGNYWVDMRQEHKKRLKDKVYKTDIKPAIVHGAECRAVRNKEERKLHTTELRACFGGQEERRD